MNPLGTAVKRRLEDSTVRLADFDALPNDALLRSGDLCFLFDCHRQTIWRKVRQGLLPKPEKVLGLQRWRVQTIRNILKKPSKR